MPVVLQVTEGPFAGKKLFLQAGQTGEVGRSEQADLSVPADAKMSSLHFAVACDPEGCHLRDLNSTNGTFLNGARVAEGALHQGDVIQAGDSLFSVSLELPDSPAAPAATAETADHPPVPAPPVTSPSSPSPSSPAAVAEPAGSGQQESPPEPLSLAEICGRAKLGDEAQRLLPPDQSRRVFVERLVEHGLLTEALGFLAHALPKRSAVSWACQCVRRGCGEHLAPADLAALEAAELWVLDPSEEHRRATMAAAEVLEYGTAASWAAMGAFWSGGSMGPPDAPSIPPDPSLTGQAVSGAVTLAAVAVEPEKAPEKQRTFIQQGLALDKDA